MFVPGISVKLGAVQLLVVVARFQPAPLRSKNTESTPLLSLAVPVTVSTGLLLWCSPDFGAVIVSNGLVVSTKVAVKLRLDCITNVNVGLLVVRLPVHSVKAKPEIGRASCRER